MEERPSIQEGVVDKRKVRAFRGREGLDLIVQVIRESPLTIYLNGEETVTLLCSGHHLKDLALGFLRSEGLIRSMEEVLQVSLKEEKGAVYVDVKGNVRTRYRLFSKRAIGAGCGKASLYYSPLDAFQLKPIVSDVVVGTGLVAELMREVNKNSPLYRATRCTHNAALADIKGSFIVSREDIGRHNAADMVIGYSLMNRIDLTDKILITTGRASSEIVIKASRAGIPILVSHSAPTSLGVDIAEHVGISLVGYVRGSRMTIYTHPERLVEP